MNSEKRERNFTAETEAGVAISSTWNEDDSRLRVEQLSPSALAYLGDAVYELFIRSHFLLPPRRICDYHNLVVAQVRAESQAACLKLLEPHLSDSEREVVRRGRNATTKCPRRLSPQIYQQATGFEALLGYLYVGNPQRLNQLLKQLELQ